MKILLRILLSVSFILCLWLPAHAEPLLIEDPHIDVELWGLPIATIRAQYHERTPQERKDVIVQGIRAIPTADNYDIKIIPAAEDDYEGAWVMVNSVRAFGLLKGDEPSHISFNEYTELVVKHLEEWLKRRDAQKDPEVIVRGVLHALFATLLISAAVYVLMRGRRSLLARLDERGKALPLHVGGIHLMPYALMLLTGIVRLMMFTVIALFCYLWLTYVLYQFPYTFSTAQNLTNYIVTMLGNIGASILASVPDLIMVVIVFWFAGVVSRIIKNISIRIETGKLQTELFDPETAKATRRVFVVLVWIFALVIAYPYIPGSNTEAFKGVSVFVGLIISLGSAGVVSQLLGGLIVVYTRAFQPGEYVKISEYEGVVSTVGVLSTKIKTIRNEEITIPNAVLLSATSTNFSRLTKESGVHISTAVTIGYDTPWQQVHHLLLTAAAKAEGLRQTPAPDVRQTGLSDFYVEYRLIAFIDDPMQKVTVLSNLHQQIQDAFAEAKVQIMSPHYEAQPEQNVLPGQWTPPEKNGA